MRRMRHPAADVQRRRHDAIRFEPLERKHGAHDINDGIERAHLVKMNLLQRDLMDRRLGFAQALKQVAGARFSLGRKRRPVDQRPYLGKAPMAVRVRDRRRRVRVLVRVRMRMTMVVPVFVRVRLVVPMGTTMILR